MVSGARRFDLLLDLLRIVVLAYVLLGWFMDRQSPVMRFLARVAEPMLQPVRQLLSRYTRNPAWSAFAPLAVILLIQALISILRGI